MTKFLGFITMLVSQVSVLSWYLPDYDHFTVKDVTMQLWDHGTTTYIVCVALRAFSEILVNAASDFKSTFHHFPAFTIHTCFFLQCYRYLKRRLTFNKWIVKTTKLLFKGVVSYKLTLRHSIAVPAWCWNAIFAMVRNLLFCFCSYWQIQLYF